jgi:hypothetical protein
MVDWDVDSTIVPKTWWVASPLTIAETALAYPLVLATGGLPHSLRAWRTLVAGWLHDPLEPGQCRGIKTVRAPGGVLLALFFFGTRSRAGHPSELAIPCLRLVEPAGRSAVLRAALQTIDSLAAELGCSEIRVRFVPRQTGSAEIDAAVAAIGRGHRLHRCGTVWVIRRSPLTPPAGSRAPARRRRARRPAGPRGGRRGPGPGSGAGARCRAARSGS